jgi:hypothetical protein
MAKASEILIDDPIAVAGVAGVCGCFSNPSRGQIAWCSHLAGIEYIPANPRNTRRPKGQRLLEHARVAVLSHHRISLVRAGKTHGYPLWQLIEA